MKTQGEIEAALCQAMSKFQEEYIGRGPKKIRTHLIDDMLVVRTQEAFTARNNTLLKHYPLKRDATSSSSLVRN